MAKKGKPTPPRRLVDKTYQAHQLLEKGRASEALPILKELDSAYPEQPEVLASLVNAYYDLHDMSNYEYAIRRLFRMESPDPELTFGLAGAYMANFRPALALRTFEEFLRRWPGHPRAARVRKEIPIIEKDLQESARELDLPYEQAYDLMLQHEELRYCLGHGEYRQARQLAEKLLRRFPNFIPALNNLGQIYAVEGQLEKSMEIARRVLQLEPENIHALSNLARLNFLSGHPVEAHEFGDRLKHSQAGVSDQWSKVAEALTFLEDDTGVLALHEQAKAAHELEPPDVDEIFYHLLGAAATFLGKDEVARKHWKKALKINPNLEWAKENLKDLEKPASQRSGPWAYPIENWLLGHILRELSETMRKQKRSSAKSEVQAALSLFFEEKHPEVIFLASHLVERGDAKARQFVVRIAAVTGHPALVEVAKGFVFGKRGAFDERMQAAQILSEAELLPSGMFQMWSEGEWREVTLLSMEISPEAVETHLPKKVRDLSYEAFEALNDRDGKRAQAALEKALALYPDDTLLLNNLSLAFELQGQTDKAHQMAREIHTRFPDYFFGIVGVARLATDDGDLEQAHELLNGLMQRKKLHTSEFVALCVAQFDVWLADGNREAARTWLEMLEKADPENPNLASMRRKVGKRTGR
jgi:tetratricopeptide (TPR) repeat protein